MKHIGILMLILCNCITAFAQTGYWTDEGNYDTSWYQTSQKEFNISTPEQLAGLAWLLNNNKIFYSDLTFNITGPISLEGHYWTPIESFNHNLEGNNNVISGMNIKIETSTKNSSTGFISYLSRSIKNLTLDNTCSVTVTSQNYEGNIGGFAGNTSKNSHINNCHFKGSIVAYGTGNGTQCMTRIGGIFGTGYAEVEECSNSGTITATFNGTNRYLNADCCGGIAGIAYQTIRHCTNNGTITGSSMTVSNFGGIAGHVGGSNKYAVVTDCINSGNITTEYKGEKSYTGIYTGGIAGRADDSSIINNCHNNGNIKAINSSKTAYSANAEAGGIVGSNYNLTINCFNTGNVSAISEDYAKAGGIASTNYGRIINCYNLGEVYSSSKDSNKYSVVAGGIVGNSFLSGEYEKVFVINCYNAGKVSGSLSSGYIGGIAGEVQHYSDTNVKSQIRNCYASMDITNGIGNDEDNQEQYIIRQITEEMKKKDFTNILNNNLSAYNDTTTQIVQATFWEQNASENSAFPYLQMASLSHEFDGYFSVMIKMKNHTPITATSKVKYWISRNETEANSKVITSEAPAIIDVIPGTEYKYQLVIEKNGLQTKHITQTFKVPSIVERCYATNIERKSATLEAQLKEESSKILKAEFVVFTEEDLKGITCNAVLKDSKATADVEGLQADQTYIARLKLTTPAGIYEGDNFSFHTANAGRYIAEVYKMSVTQTAIQFETIVGVNTKEPLGTLKEYGTYYINIDSIGNNNPEDVSYWKKAKGTYIETFSSGQSVFKMQINDLTQNSTYLMKSYVIVSIPGEGDIEELLENPSHAASAKTLPVTLTLNEVENITQTEAKLSCTIEAGDAIVIEKGFMFEESKLAVKGDDFSITMKNLLPDRTYYYNAYAILSNGSTVYSESDNFTTSGIYISTEIGEITQTSALIEISCNMDNDMIDTKGIEWASNGEIMQLDCKSKCRITELPANSTVFYRGYVKINDAIYYSEDKKLNTLEIKTSFEAADAISNTSATLHATVECDTYSSAQFGFEWRKYDAPDLVPSNTVIAEQLIKGKIAFSLRGLSPSTYYKYRSFVKYKNKEYFSEWTAFGTADSFVLWAPKVETFPTIDIKGTDVTMYGYVIPGSEEVMQKGFEYWIKSQKDNILYATVKDDNMQAKVTGLQPFTTYCYRAFAKTASGTTYGQEFEFTTESGTGINSVQDNSFKVCLMNNPVSDEACIKINGLQGNRIIYKIYSVQGHLVKTGNTETQDSTDTIFIDTRELTGGLYILQISNDKQTQTLKMIIR